MSAAVEATEGAADPADPSRADPEEPTPQQWADRWKKEFSAAKKEVEKWHRQSDKLVRRFRDERERRSNGDTRWNLFPANIQTLQAMLYGQTPKVTVGRRFADAKDSVARVAGELLERLLNTDLQRASDGYAAALENALSDRLLVGQGTAWARYVFSEAKPEAPTPPIFAKHPVTGEQVMGPDGQPVELAPAVPVPPRKAWEDVEIDYVYWKDQLWSPARVWADVRWVARRAQMSRAELIKRFGEVDGKAVPLNAKRAKGGAGGDTDDSKQEDPWGRADVWEIWSKEHLKVFWLVEDYQRVLDVRDDPYELENFFPCPRPMSANLTTSSMVPRADFVLAQDLYDEVDTVSTRITIIERAIRVVGVYDSSAGEIQRLVGEAENNELIPVSTWAMFAEKGGIKGCVDFLPLDQIVSALDALRSYRTELVSALYQITGMSDIMRGQAAETSVTATEQQLKGRFASVRVQRLQDDFARFASDIQRIKAEIIEHLFDAETILARSNAAMTFDSDMAQQAVALLKDRMADYRIEVKPESVSMTDMAQLKNERTEFLGAMSGFLQAAAPLAQAMPGSMPFLLEVLKWTVTGLRGSSTIEGVLDQAVLMFQQQSQQQASQPQVQQPDPKLLAAQAKGQIDLQKEQAKTQGRLVEIRAETDADNERQRAQAEWNVREQAAKEHIRSQTRAAEKVGGVVPSIPGVVDPMAGGTM